MDKILSLSPVIPVIRFTDLEHCNPLGEALLSSGIGIIEVALRSDIALQAIKKLSLEFPELTVGAGTVLSEKNALDAVENGARFVVSPGINLDLEKNLTKIGVPFLPGTSSVTEMMKLLEKGFTHLKFFPAASSGGIEFLKAIHPVLPGLKFCPTGGIDKNNVMDWLALPNVICVGGSLIAPDKLIQDENWEEIRKRALWASGLKLPS
tara:strand:- start:503 stop:1126 length:624 start_codon:yes stop_codon:yes gene_type:complete